jgi:hypothetical protein
MAVVMMLVRRQHAAQMAFVVDQEPVRAFAADGADPAFGDRVRPWCADRCPDHPDTQRGEHLIEHSGELRVTVPDEEPHLFGPLAQAHDQVAGLLGDPCPGRVRRGAGDVHDPGGVLDEEQHVDPLEQHGVDMEQVAGPDPFGLRFQKLRPGRARRAAARATEALCDALQLPQTTPVRRSPAPGATTFACRCQNRVTLCDLHLFVGESAQTIAPKEC